MIKLQDVEKNYTNGILSFKALNGINLQIKEGEFTSIIGSSGSGKSTIMNILGCLDIPSSGSYFLDGVDITRNECYQRMVDNPKTYPKTSLPSVDLFYKAFERGHKQPVSSHHRHYCMVWLFAWK